MPNTQPTVQNELFTRLTSCAKTVAQWATTVNTPMKGESCWEIHENGDSATGLPYTYRLKIGDGQTPYANLPYYGDFVTLHTANNESLAVAHWNSTDNRMEFYNVTETNGIVALTSTPSLALSAGDKVTLSAATVGGVLVTSVSHTAQTASDITEDTATLTDGGSFKVATGKDSYGHINKWTTFTLPNIATAISTAINNLDSSVSASDDVHVLVGVVERDGILLSASETEIVGGDKLSVEGVSGSITIHHDTTNVPAPSGTPTQLSDNGEFTIYSGNDAYGHVNQKTTLKLPNMASIATTEIGKLDSSVATTGNAKVLVGVTQTDGKLTAKDEKEVVGEQKITVEGTSTQIKVKHNTQTIGTDTAETLTDGGSFTVYSSVDEYGHVTKTKVFTLPSIATLIAALDSSQEVDGTNANKSVLRGVTEVDGKLTSHKQTTFVDGTKTTVTGTSPDANGNNTIQINHSNIDTSAADASSGITTDGGSTVGEKELDVITGMTVDAQGHVTHIDKDISTNLVAADIKAPVKRQDDSTWNFRETGGDITIGEDTTRIPVLKGNTLVWNQNGLRIFNGTGWSASPNETLSKDVTVTKNTSSTDEQVSALYLTAPDYVINNVYLFTFNAQANENVTMNFRWGSWSTPSSTSRFHINVDTSVKSCKFVVKYSGPFSVQACYIGLQSAGTGTALQLSDCCVFNLTKMFGDDTTICERLGVENLTDETNLKLAATNFEKLFPNSYYPYCEGRLVNLGGYGVKWNQLYDTTVPTAETDHKYYLSEVVSSTKTSSISTTISYTSGSTNRMCIDLTMMFGPGSEPTIEEFEAMFPNDYYEYNAGTEMNIFDAIGDKKLGLESTGFNQWDEEWENGGIDYSTGRNYPDSTCIRSKGFIPTIPNEDYYFKHPTAARLIFYDSDKNFITGSSILHTSDIFHTESNYYYVRFHYTGTTYSSDTCINLSSSRNGEYEPYKESTLDLSWIKDIKYIPSGSTEEQQLFPYGLLSAGSVHDEVTETRAIKRVGSVDLGLFNYSYQDNSYWTTNIENIGIVNKESYSTVPNFAICSAYTPASRATLMSMDKVFGFYLAQGFRLRDSSFNNYTPSQVSDALNGVMLYYELATPVEIPLAETHRMSYVVDDHGTEQQLPINVSSVINAPFRGTFEYMSNFKETVLRIIDTVNSYKNPVKGANNTDQIENKLAVYDSTHTVKSSVYGANKDATVFSGEDRDITLPTVQQVIDYVTSSMTSSLTYKGTIPSKTSIPTSNRTTGDLWVIGADIEISGTDVQTYGFDGEYDLQVGNFIIWNETHWDVVQGENHVTNNNPTIALDGSVYTVGNVEGTNLSFKTPNLDVNDPTASGQATNLQVITSVSQTDGLVSAEKRTIPDASTTQKGVTSFVRDIHGATETNKVPSAKQAWDEFAKRNVSAVPVAPVPTPPPTSEYYTSYQLEQSSSPDFTVTNKNFAEAYAASMGGYLFYVKNGVVYAAKLKASDWTKFADGTTVTSAVRAATETMIHVPTCRYKASGTTMKFGGLNPLFEGKQFNSPQWVGAYQMDANGHSRPGVGSGHSKTMSQFWDLAQAIHTGFGLANFEFHNLINALYQALNGNLNSEYVLSDGNSRSSANWDKYRDLAHGHADTIGDGSGCVQATDASSTTRYVTKFCGFEDIFGKLWEFRPGIRFYMDGNTRNAVVYDGNMVSNNADGRIISGVLSSASGGYVTAMECGEHWDMLPKTVGGSSTTYYCDGHTASTGGQVMCVGGSADNGSLCGIASSLSNIGFSESDGSVGARLAFYEEPTIVSGEELVALMA